MKKNHTNQFKSASSRGKRNFQTSKSEDGSEKDFPQRNFKRKSHFASPRNDDRKGHFKRDEHSDASSDTRGENHGDSRFKSKSRSNYGTNRNRDDYKPKRRFDSEGEKNSTAEGENRSARPRFNRDKPFGKDKAFGRDKPFNRDKPFDRDRSFDRDAQEKFGPSRERGRERNEERGEGRPQRSFRPREERGEEGENRSARPRFNRDKPFGKDRAFGRDKPFNRDKPFDRDRPFDRDAQEKFGRSRERGRERNEERGEGRPQRSFRPRSENDKKFGGDRRSFAGKPPFKDKFKPRQNDTPSIDIPEEKEGQVLFWGTHAVHAALLNPARNCLAIWTTAGEFETTSKIVAEAREQGLLRPDPKKSEKEDIQRLVPAGTVHQGLAALFEVLPDTTLADIIESENAPDLLVVLDQVTDPHNIGAILRSASAFGAGGVIVTERNAPAATGVTAKSASGAVEHIKQITVVNLARSIKELQKAGYWCVGLAEEGQRSLAETDVTNKVAVILGSEGEGLRRLTRENCDELVKLPTGGPIGSLNVSNAAAIALYEVRRQKLGKVQ